MPANGWSNTSLCAKIAYLNQYLFQAPTAERQAVADAIAARFTRELAAPQPARRGWLSDEALKDSLHFDVKAFFAFQWEPPAGPLV